MQAQLNGAAVTPVSRDLAGKPVLLVALDGHPVPDATKLHEALQALPPGSQP